VYKEEGLRKAPEKAQDAGGHKKLNQNLFLQDFQQTTFPHKEDRKLYNTLTAVV
jgi:hypothetical protein